ncbi:hypothetical protein H4R18_001243 [Coemansia javaensis]|uniref:N-acetyltransferase domain-containing protein n=1 Tax=Coemansia javaensis TaxID=2761396 RepID=A0A9W8LLW7_9FUNG|nr:hypothetical protein H4R18_001243 [Coemansia javaensis]
MGPYSIRVASAAEQQQAVGVRIRVFVEIQKFPLETEVDELDEAAVHVVLVDESLGGRVVGTLRIIRAGDAAKLGRVVVLPEHQGRGLGRRLVEFAEQHIAAAPEFRECTHVKLGSQCDKRGFYEKCGYAAEGDVYDELGCPHIWMHKPTQRTQR